MICVMCAGKPYRQKQSNLGLAKGFKTNHKYLITPTSGL